eukprot:COSAG04_NODE_2835_length_3512_cov_1.795781_6_plen_106_part_01
MLVLRRKGRTLTCVPARAVHPRQRAQDGDTRGAKLRLSGHHGGETTAAVKRMAPVELRAVACALGLAGTTLCPPQGEPARCGALLLVVPANATTACGAGCEAVDAA